MNFRRPIHELLAHEQLNFLLTNRVPRRLLTRAMGRFSQIEWPPMRAASIAAWRFFCDVDLSDARQARFKSLHEAFVRELKSDARPVDADSGVLASPCDAIIGAHGAIDGARVFQIKGSPYTLDDLLGPDTRVDTWRDGVFVTLRLTAGMYHRFHAPHDCVVEEFRYYSGDTWNVNSPALKRVERLFCKNERVFVHARITAEGACQGLRIALVPVAAILVASLRLHFSSAPLHLGYQGPRRVACDSAFAKGEEMGWFEHGSTILVFAPREFRLSDRLREGSRIRMGEALMLRGA
jgi:phosphatidylserine decarboxylase